MARCFMVEQGCFPARKPLPREDGRGWLPLALNVILRPPAFAHQVGDLYVGAKLQETVRPGPAGI